MKIGFMQGRLCDQIDGKIQAFPWRDWQLEFQVARSIDIQLMEWTLDDERIYENPLMTAIGQEKILELCQRYCISIPSLTGDCFMQAPFWKTDGILQNELQSKFLAVCQACANLGIGIVVVPLVDNGRIESLVQENILVDFLLRQQQFFADNQLQIIFETDFMPIEVARFIDRLPVNQFGINYDIGNSAALGFSLQDEFSTYGGRILNVHIKDRMLGGTTVPLMTGSADFDSVFSALSRLKYQGNFILQTARAINLNHAEVLCEYRDMTITWMNKYGF